jgi:hypothetical protein
MRKWKPRWVVAATLVALFAASAYFQCNQPVAPGVNQASFLKIKPGMSLAEVESVLGGPPSFENFAAMRQNNWNSMILTRRILQPCARWDDGAAHIMVWFDEKDEKVLEVKPYRQPIQYWHDNPGLFNTFLDWCKCQWQRWCS